MPKAPVLTSTATEQLNTLLQRGLVDDSHEGDNAFRLLRKRMKVQGLKPRFFLLPDYNDDEDPMVEIYDEHVQEIANLKARIAELENQLEAVSEGGPIPKTGEFPWPKFPKEEEAICRAFLDGARMESLEDMLEELTGFRPDNTSKPARMRVANKEPPRALYDVTEVKVGDGPITWGEIWKIATQRHGKEWLKRSLSYAGNIDRIAPGDTQLPKNLHAKDPNDLFRPAERARLRSLYHSDALLNAGDEFVAYLKSVGSKGATKSMIARRAIDSRRRLERQKSGECFAIFDTDKDEEIFVHTDFADDYPEEPAAEAAKIARERIQKISTKKK